METLHLACFASAALGLAGLGLHALWTRRHRKASP
jgi:hypothetical protein